jgi:hypothetical protein
MSQVTQPRISIQPTRVAVVGAALAIVALAAVVLIIALSTGSSDNAKPATVGAQPSLRSDGGPEETSVATAAGSGQVSSGPDESAVAAAIGGH